MSQTLYAMQNKELFISTAQEGKQENQMAQKI